MKLEIVRQETKQNVVWDKQLLPSVYQAVPDLIQADLQNFFSTLAYFDIKVITQNLCTL
jgi:hypothetical protein